MLYVFQRRASITISSVQATLLRTYSGLGKFIQECGKQVVTAIKGLEARKEKFSMYNFRPLEQLLTPQSRQEVLTVMIDPEATIKDIEAAIRRSRHRMWCRFVWDKHPKLDDDKSMPSCTPFMFLSRKSFVLKRPLKLN